MAPVPVLMILYTSDAVEIRYSDGSCLELSPCGSAMIHHGAPGRREPKHGGAVKVQKRTRFVTSEHRQKVIQALDFRNRFAERPYICEDLLPKEDIVALYARIESIAWPKLPGEAKIDVLPDGSRRITSLDEFASLVISPHGHDFTVCYLSRLSEEGMSRSKSSLAHQSNSRTSGKCFQPSSEKENLDKLKNLPLPNGAVVQPFEITTSSDDMQIKCSRLSCEGLHSVSSDNANKMQEAETENVRLDNLNNSEHEPATLATQHTSHTEQRLEAHNVTSKKKEINLVNSLENNNKSSLNSTQTSDIKNNDHDRRFTEHNILPYCTGVHSEQTHKPSFPFSDACSDCQDISSISRSSTPDGLRATIDSDATLTNENIAESFHEHNPVHEKQHSSPTQYTSSPYDVQELAHSRELKRVRVNVNASLASSFLGDQKLHQWEEIGREPNAEIPKEFPNSFKDESSLLADDDDCPGTMPNNTHPLENAVENQFLLNLQHSDKPVGHKIQPGNDCSTNRSAEKNARILDLEADSRNVNFELEFNVDSASRAKLAEKCSDISQMGQEENVESWNRERYVWTTRHCSRNECPIAWMHPLRLALGETKTAEGSATSQPSTNRSQGATLKTNEKTACTYTRVPSPLPVTCPFQHKGVHNYDDDDDANENSASNVGEFQHGRLKIVISEGVVYRLVHWTDMKIVEIHPGDGSVFVSEGVKGHFFTHYIVVEDQLQERTYSLKSLPRQKMEGRYSVGKLVEMGNRLLMMNNEWQQRGLKDDVPCWKREVVAVVEPLSSSLLEECHVDGLGRFTAFTNGRVRIVFEDRTALDMVCNFSRRVKECLHHSQEPLVVSLPCANSVAPPMPTVDSIFGTNSGRLLLPSGRYVTVDIRKPGEYRNYIQIAQEWASWVGSSPLERNRFYSEYHTPALLQQAAEIELKKIFCFNYILEQTMLMQQEQLNSRKSDTTKDRTSQPSGVSGPKTSPSQPPPYHNPDDSTGLYCDLQPNFHPTLVQHLSTSSITTHLNDERNKSSLPLNNSTPGSSLPCGQDKARTIPQRVEPTRTMPQRVEPTRTMPQRVEPTRTMPQRVEPTRTMPQRVEPTRTMPQRVEPTRTIPQRVEPTRTMPQRVEPTRTMPQRVEPTRTMPQRVEPTRTIPQRVEPTRTMPQRVEPTRTIPQRVEPTRTIPQRVEPTRTMPQRVEPTRTMPQRVEPTRTIPQRVEPTRTIPQRVEPTRTMPQRVEPTRTMPQRVEPTRTMPQRVEPTRTMPQRVEPTRTMPQRVEPTRTMPQRVEPTSTMPQRVEPTSATWALRAEYRSSRKTEDIIMGFESVRQVLLQNSSMINDIEQFLETSRKP